MPDRKPVDWALLPLKKYADFNGRASRSEYWWFWLLTGLVNIPASLIDRLFGMPVFQMLVGFGLLLPGVAVAVRRLHDLDHRGWWLLVPAVATTLALTFGVLASTAASQPARGAMRPMQAEAMLFVLIAWLAMAFLLVSFCRRGTVGSNRFGPDPLLLRDPAIPYS